MLAFVIENWLLIAAALVSGGLLAWPLVRGGVGGGVTPAQAVQLMNRDKAVVIDVRDATEFAAGHVVGARNVPLATLGESPKALPANKKQPLVLVCAAGVRARRAASTLRAAGYENLHVLAGGVNAWRQADLPLESAAR